MIDPDERLKALFAKDDPPARDPGFVVETLHRLHRRRLWLELAAGVPWVIAASAIFWLATPWLVIVSRLSTPFMGVLAPVISLVMAAVVLAWPRSHQA